MRSQVGLVAAVSEPTRQVPWPHRLVHDGAFTYSADVVRLGLVKVILTGDRPGIVTDFVARHVLTGFVTQPRKCQISSATDH